MGGKDDSGFYLFDIFPDGTISTCDEYISSGSGSVMAYGVLETLYDPNINVEEGIKLAAKCVNAAVQRDIASGNGLDVVTITGQGAQKVLQKIIKTLIEV